MPARLVIDSSQMIPDEGPATVEVEIEVKVWKNAASFFTESFSFEISLWCNPILNQDPLFLGPLTADYIIGHNELILSYTLSDQLACQQFPSDFDF